MVTPSTVEVVICTRNRPQTVTKIALGCLRLQSVRPTRVLVWDASDPAECELVESMTRQMHDLNVEYVRAPRKGSASQRNDAIACLTSDIVLFIDDDIALPRDGLEVLRDLLDSHPSASGAQLAIAARRVSSVPPWLRRAYTLYATAMGLEHPARNQRITRSGAQTGIPCAWPTGLHGHRGVCSVEWLQGGCMAYRLKHIRAAGLRFDERLQTFGGYALAEDSMFSASLVRRCQSELLWTDQSIAVHLPDRTSRFANESMAGAVYAFNGLCVWHEMCRTLKGGKMALFRRFVGYALFSLLRGSPRTVTGMIRGTLEYRRQSYMWHAGASDNDSTCSQHEDLT